MRLYGFLSQPGRRVDRIRLDVERLDERIVPANYTTRADGLPILHSRPTAATAIYLDFDGDTTTATTAYSEDADSTTFNTTEQTNIYEAWRQMAAYYAMFDTDVTTEAPAASFPKVWMMEGNNISGGYSYVGVFPNSKPESFNQSGDTRGRVSGIAHEAGHNWGLSHQSQYDLYGVKTAEYIGQLDPLHGPIMGVDYSGQVHKFIIGHPSSSPSTLQDDLAVIAAKIKAREAAGGDGYAPDDFGGTVATATALTVNGGTQSAFGVIERAADIDAFSFTADGRTFIGVTPDYPSQLDARIEVYDGSGTLIAAADDPTNDQHLNLDLAAGTYYLRVAGHGNYADIGGYNVQVAPGVPADWWTRDIGTVSKAGASTFDTASGTYTITGGGADIWGTADEFQFAYRTLSGNGSITARVDSITASNGSAKAGVMIRESTAAGAKNVAMLATASSGYQSQVRSSTGGSTTNTTNGSGAFTVKYVRITRTGNTFVTAVSSNGTTFTNVSTYTVTMGTDVLIGLAVTSHNDEEERAIVGTSSVPTVNTATFDLVNITGSATATPATNALPAPTGVSNPSATAAGGFTLTWGAVTGATGYTVERSANGVDYTSAGSTASGVTTFTDGSLPGSQRYFYRVRATDATGRSDPSDVVSGFNVPAAVTNLSVTSWTNDKLILNWTDTSGETGYRIEQSTDGVTYTTLATVGVNVPSYTATGLTATTKRYYRVVPTSSLGEGVAALTSGTTRLPAVTGLAITAYATNQLTLGWSAVTGATGYRIDRSTDGTTFTTLTTTTTTATTYANTGLTDGSEYYYRVYGVDASGGLSAIGTTVFGTTTDLNALPAGWLTQDIGSVGGAGAAGYNGGTFTIVGSGADIWGTSDAFRFTYQTLSGNGSITAKVVTAENTNTNAKIGVMIRESLAANSKYSMVAVTGSAGLAMQSRTTTGGSAAQNASTAGITAPYWVRVVRSGNTVTGYSSTDGVTWTTTGTATLSTLATNVYIGLAVTSHDNTLLNTSSFSNVSVTPPKVASVKVNNGQSDLIQRSEVTSLTVAFNTAVTLAAQSSATPTFTLSGYGVSGSAISVAPANISVTNPSGDGATYVLTWSGTGTDNGSLVDGSWALNIAASAVSAPDGSHLAANYVSRTSGVGIIRLFGDISGDGFVDATDLSRFSSALGSLQGDVQYSAPLDWNNDSFIDATDLSQFTGRLGLAVFADVTGQTPVEPGPVGNPPLDPTVPVEVVEGQAGPTYLAVFFNGSLPTNLGNFSATGVDPDGNALAAVDTTVEMSTTGQGQGVAILSFSGPGAPAGTLEAGVWSIQTTNTSIAPPTTVKILGDWNGDGIVDAADVSAFQESFEGALAGWEFDTNGDGILDIRDQD